MFSFFNPWKYQKTFGFLVFQGAQHRNGKIGQKWTKGVNRYKILINPLSVSFCLSLSLCLSVSLCLSLSLSVSVSLFLSHSLFLSYSPVEIVLIAKNSITDSLNILCYFRCSRNCLFSINQSKVGIYIRNHLS